MSTPEQDAKNWISVREAVSAALIIGSGVFYLSYWFAMFRKQGRRSYIYMNEVANKYYLFGLGALLSLNYAQAGIFQTIMIFVTMITFFGTIASALLPNSIDHNKRSIMFIIFYSSLFIWYLGIIIDFFVTFN